MLDIIENGINWTKTKKKTKNNIKGILTTLSIQYLTNIFCKVTLNSHVQYKSMAHLLWKILQQAIKFNLKKMGEKKVMENEENLMLSSPIRHWAFELEIAESMPPRVEATVKHRALINVLFWPQMGVND